MKGHIQIKKGERGCRSGALGSLFEKKNVWRGAISDILEASSKVAYQGKKRWSALVHSLLGVQ